MVSYSLFSVKVGIGRFGDVGNQAVKVLNKPSVAHQRDQCCCRDVSGCAVFKLVDGHHGHAGFCRQLGLSEPKGYSVLFEPLSKQLEDFSVRIPFEHNVHITLTVNQGGKDTLNLRNIIYPETGAGLFEEDDKVYVANNGHYVGVLTYIDGLFEGAITSPNTNDYLHFYFFGNKVDPADEFSAIDSPLTFEAKTAPATVTFDICTSAATTPVLISTDGENWSTYSSGDPITLNNVGNKVMFSVEPTTLMPQVLVITNTAIFPVATTAMFTATS